MAPILSEVSRRSLDFWCSLFFCTAPLKITSQIYILSKNDDINKVWLWRTFSLVRQASERDMIKFLSWISDYNSTHSVLKYVGNLFTLIENSITNPRNSEFFFLAKIYSQILYQNGKHNCMLFTVCRNVFRHASVSKYTKLFVTTWIWHCTAPSLCPGFISDRVNRTLLGGCALRPGHWTAEPLPWWPSGRTWANCGGAHALVQACPTHGLHVDQRSTQLMFSYGRATSITFLVKSLSIGITIASKMHSLHLFWALHFLALGLFAR